MRLRPGRPPGPTAGRGPRPWDPRRLGWEERRILDHVAANPDKPRWMIAEHFGISLSHLSIIACSPEGVKYLASAASSPGSPRARRDPLEDV